ncbi:MAG TPA: hypothetical protein VFN38_15300, partial [Gemmatimonadaceae bacterium]|nr:hypothetical protein [Gemmatimonadaceae bacterium]
MMRRALALAALGTLLAPTWRAGAQSVFDSELRLAPQFLQYRLKDPAGETISQVAVPLFVSVPLSERLTIDVGTSYARSRVVAGGAASEISGLTDTQVRGNLTL